jgi:RNA polymerase sigma-70 factor (ECF subfamily)
MADRTDEDIALMVQRGDTQSFEVLVARYEAKMLRYARKFLFGFGPDDIKDVVQDVFIKAYMNIQSFDAKRTFSPWLYRIAHNQFINMLRKRGTEHITFFDADTLFPHADHEDTEIRRHELAELKEMFDKCLDKLDPKYREPLVLYYFEEVDYQEISEIMQIPVSTVGVRLKRGKTALKKIFEIAHPHHE